MPFTPFTLQTLIGSVALEDPQQNSSQNFGGGNRLGSRLTGGIGRGIKDCKVVVESVEAWENNLYVGTSDGHLIHYTLEDQISSGDSAPRSQLISKRALGFGKRNVERILLFPQIGQAMILCDSTLSCYSLPDMEPMPTSNFPYIKGVSCFCHDISMEGKTEDDGTVKICVMKKRAIHAYSLSDGWIEEASIPLPDGAITACQYGPYVCVADNIQYKMINLRAKRMDPIMPYADNRSSAMSGETFSPIVTVIGDGEFLLALPADGQMTIGQFISSRGEPIRGTLQWQSFPRAIGVEFPYVVALLRNNSIEIHNILEQQFVQMVPLVSKARTISTGPGIKVRVTGLMEKLRLENLFSTNNDNDAQSLQLGSDAKDGHINFLPTVPTRLIIAGSEIVSALVTAPLTVQVDTMLDANLVEEALDLAEQAISTATPENIYSERMRHEFNYIHQKSGFIYLRETYIDLAFPLFERGKTDPRILIRMFNNLKEVINEDEPVNIYSGVRAVSDPLGNIENIVSGNLVKNYDPHIKPDLETAPAAQELRKILITNAKEMLQKFLTKDREQRKATGRALTKDDKVILRAVDNSLIRLYAEFGRDDLLKNLLEGENECILELCEKILIDNKKFYPLSLLYKDKNEYRKALEIWKLLIEQKDPGYDVSVGLQQMANLLGKLDDPNLFWEYANWVIQKDETIGAKIFIQKDPKKSLLVEPNKILSALRSAGNNGLRMFLEYLITSRKSQEESYHTELALLYIQDILKSLEEEAKSKIERLTNEFTNSKTAGQTYLTFLLSQPADDLLSQARANLIIFFQSSTQYNANDVLMKLKEAEILKAELAVVYGKLNQHESALHILISDLRDYRGAEIYCLHAGRMIGKVQKSISKKQAEKKLTEEKALTSTIRALFLMLVKVYLEMDNGVVERIIHLLNTQSVYLDIMEVLALLPECWSVEMLNEFLVRSLRQSYNEYREGQILKGLCKGENTMISYEIYQAYQDIGPVLITQNVTCSSCSKYISGSEFMRLPNNDIMHANCNSHQQESIDSASTVST